jgi:hypothetical protein
MLSSSFASWLPFFLILCYAFLIYLTVTHKWQSVHLYPAKLMIFQFL